MAISKRGPCHLVVTKKGIHSTFDLIIDKAWHNCDETLGEVPDPPCAENELVE